MQPTSLTRQSLEPKLNAADDLLDDLFGVTTDDYLPSAWWNGGARPAQLPPSGDWQLWMILAGRGFGKSRAVNEWAIEQARKYPGSRGALVATTAADVRDVIIGGHSGILSIATPEFMPVYEPSKRLLTFPNGSIALTFSAEKPSSLRGPQFHWAICDELAAWRYGIETFDMLLMGVRLGTDPRIAISTTPRPTKLVKSLLSDPTCAVARGTTYENRANLAPSWFEKIISRYEGTTLGRQELEGAVVDAIEGALWQYAMIEAARVNSAPELQRVVVAIDPAVTANEDSDETGIVVAGSAYINNVLHGFVLDDLSLRGSPDTWARRAIGAYYDQQADRILAEVNNGGDMIEHTIRTIDSRVAFSQVRASRGKAVRAEPIAALYEQGRVHHVGVFAALEDQMTSWIPNTNAKSPDRMDALVWALTELLLEAGDAQFEPLPDWVARWRG